MDPGACQGIVPNLLPSRLYCRLWIAIKADHINPAFRQDSRANTAGWDIPLRGSPVPEDPYVYERIEILHPGWIDDKVAILGGFSAKAESRCRVCDREQEINV